ncbi:MAG TPA: hypothetical protein VEW95_03390 [Candidatus Limnocylindrales bacterium]|nr:hypothetical protein [Candidatus Limnocylindrales bacterium]
MAETLTESFCERCGTRYEFQAPTRLNPLRKTRGLFGGLKNYLTSQDALSDAMGDAMRSEEDNLASAQLDAFHESFNFCIDCRQYTCVNCWNDDAGRCRSCAPIPGTDDLAERLAASAVVTPAIAEEVLAQDDLHRRLGLEAWPTSDLATEEAVASNGHPVESWPTAEALPVEPEPMVAEIEVEPEPLVADVEPEPEPLVAEIEPEPEPVVAEIEVEPQPEPVVAEIEVEPEPVVAEIEVEPQPEPVVAEIEVEPEPVVAEIEPEPWPVAAEEAQPWPVAAEEAQPWPVAAEEAEPEPVAAEEPEPIRPPLRVVAWDEDSAYQVVEPEPIVPEPEPVAAEVEPEPEPVAAEVEPEVEPVAAEVEPEPVIDEPTPIRSPRRLAPISETILDFPTKRTPDAPAADDRAAAVIDTPELAARRAQLDSLGLGDPGQGPIAPDRSEMPYRSRGAAVSAADLARLASLQGSFWEASAREVAGAAGHVGVQSCGQCGLSLSANARFCRRCGTRQAQSA